MLTRQQIEKADNRFAVAPVPSWGGDVLLMRVSALELREILRMFAADDEDGDQDDGEQEVAFFAELASRSIVKEDRKTREFDDDAGRDFLKGIDPEAFAILNKAVLDLHKLGVDDDPKNDS